MRTLILVALLVSGCTTWPVNGLNNEFNVTVPPFVSLQWKFNVLSSPATQPAPPTTLPAFPATNPHE